MKDKILIACMVTYYFVRELWAPWRFRKEYFKPFPFNPEIEIAKQTYLSMILGYAGMVIITGVIYQMANSHKLFWGCVVVLAALEFVEYPLNYNDFWTWLDFGLFKLPINVTILRYFVLLFVGGYELWKN